ncbi:MAG: phosphatase PAP2 family protein [Clostridiales bacterium]|nr:phosphatase PAP2 family protein [Clostridiales bacterium]
MDIAILKWFHEVFHSQTWLNYIMKYITYIGEFAIGAILCAVVLLIFKKTRWAGVAVAIAFLINVLIVNVILKLAVNRARPWQTYPDLGFQEFHNAIGVREPTDSSFPSGHTASLFAAAVALVMYYKVKGLPALAVAFVVALSRIYLCMHFPTDVLGGMVIGSLCGVAGYYIMKPVKKFLLKKLPWFGVDDTKKDDAPPEQSNGEGEQNDGT